MTQRILRTVGAMALKTEAGLRRCATMLRRLGRKASQQDHAAAEKPATQGRLLRLAEQIAPRGELDLPDVLSDARPPALARIELEEWVITPAPTGPSATRPFILRLPADAIPSLRVLVSRQLPVPLDGEQMVGAFVVAAKTDGAPRWCVMPPAYADLAALQPEGGNSFPILLRMANCAPAAEQRVVHSEPSLLAVGFCVLSEPQRRRPRPTRAGMRKSAPGAVQRHSRFEARLLAVFSEFCSFLAKEKREVVLRLHPGGQWVEKKSRRFPEERHGQQQSDLQSRSFPLRLRRLRPLLHFAQHGPC
jgi:hypothetical protein